MLCLEGGVAERSPHVHDRKSNLLALLGSQPLEELVHALFGAVLASEPDWPPTQQIADHDPVRVSLPNRDLVDSDHLGSWVPRSAELFPHVLHL